MSERSTEESKPNTSKARTIQSKLNQIKIQNAKPKQTQKKLNLNLNQSSSLRTPHINLCVCISLCTTVVHNTAQNSSDNVPSYYPDNHHS